MREKKKNNITNNLSIYGKSKHGPLLWKNSRRAIFVITSKLRDVIIKLLILF